MAQLGRHTAESSVTPQSEDQGIGQRLPVATQAPWCRHGLSLGFADPNLGNCTAFVLKSPKGVTSVQKAHFPWCRSSPGTVPLLSAV